MILQELLQDDEVCKALQAICDHAEHTITNMPQDMHGHACEDWLTVLELRIKKLIEAKK